MKHSHTVEFPLFLQSHYITNMVVVKKFYVLDLFLFHLEKQYPLWSSFWENDPYTFCHQI